MACDHGHPWPERRDNLRTPAAAQEQEEHGSLRQQSLFERIPFDERGIDDQPAAAYDDEPLGRNDWEDYPWPLTILTSEQEASLCELGPEAYRS